MDNKLRVLKHFAFMDCVPDEVFLRTIQVSLEFESKWGLPIQEILAHNPKTVDLLWGEVELSIPFNDNTMYEISKNGKVVYKSNDFVKVMDELKAL